MDKLFFDCNGKLIEWEGREQRKEGRFPVCLSVVYHGHSTESCADFILNISRSGVFVLTRQPLPIGSEITLKFYIPPEEHVLSEFEGIVAGVNTDNPGFPKGMHVRFTASVPEDLKKLEDFLEGKKHLLDTKA
ncbi:hypothetical protein ANRL2_03336 [Anaerolineae bacterium]|nr:hypothetical protein ANRL2_03336 [Anaerolineae bacterium]